MTANTETELMLEDAPLAELPPFYTAVTGIRWANAESTLINCLVTIPSVDAAPLPMSVAAEDPAAPYVEEIFARAVAGEFGEIALYQAPVAPPPSSISRRQFRLQLLSMGQLDAVEAWIDAQPVAVRIAYESSAAFVRDDAMMAAGFDALGFEPAQVDAFFTAAAGL